MKCINCGKEIKKLSTTKKLKKYHSKKEDYTACNMTCSRECRIKFNHSRRFLGFHVTPELFEKFETYCKTLRRSKRHVLTNLIIQEITKKGEDENRINK